jgi:hypothetical protein
MKKRFALAFISVVFLVTGLWIGSVRSAEEGMLELGTGKRKHVDVDFQQVRFPHRMHQKAQLEVFGGDKEKACSWCHHKKRKGRDPRACRRCHAGRRVKSKGGAGRQGFVSKRVRKGKLLAMKDVFHVQCKGCHQDLKDKDEDLMADETKAPLICDGCHVPKKQEEGAANKSKKE